MCAVLKMIDHNSCNYLLVFSSDGEEVDLELKTNIEGAIIKWTQQVHDLLQEDSYLGM